MLVLETIEKACLSGGQPLWTRSDLGTTAGRGVAGRRDRQTRRLAPMARRTHNQPYRVEFARVGEVESANLASWQACVGEASAG
jgi:ribosomal protein L15